MRASARAAGARLVRGGRAAAAACPAGRRRSPNRGTSLPYGARGAGAASHDHAHPTIRDRSSLARDPRAATPARPPVSGLRGAPAPAPAPPTRPVPRRRPASPRPRPACAPPTPRPAPRPRPTLARSAPLRHPCPSPAREPVPGAPPAEPSRRSPARGPARPRERLRPAHQDPAHPPRAAATRAGARTRNSLSPHMDHTPRASGLTSPSPRTHLSPVHVRHPACFAWGYPRFGRAPRVRNDDRHGRRSDIPLSHACSVNTE